jgi:putative multiple sugar transport system substrate-binding protein
MKKTTLGILAAGVAAALALAGCSSSSDNGGSGSTGEATVTSTASEPSGGDVAGGFAADATIGVGLPQKTSENWVRAENMFNEGLKAAGFNPMVLFADNGVSEQQNQINTLVESDSKVIVVGAIDGSQLGEQLANAKSKGAYVIAYDRLLKNTEDVDLYVAYDPFKVGELQGEALLEGLAKKGSGPYNVELIAGSADDANSTPFFEGAMSKLQPKIDDGTLVIPSGQTTFDQVATEGWLAEKVQARFDTLLSGFYSDGTKLDGVLSPNDTLARAALTAVETAGLATPVITGQDSEVESVKLILEGKQYSTINKDTGVLVNKVIEIIQGLQKGENPTPTATANNGVIDVATVYLDPVIVTSDNVCTAYAGDPVVEAVVQEASQCK